MKDIGAQLKQIRTSLDLTLAEMGKLLGKGKGSISKYENGDASPPLATLLKYAEIGGVTLDWIFTNKKNSAGGGTPQPVVISEPETGYSPEIETLIRITKNNPLIKLIIPGMAELSDDEQFEIYKLHKEIKARRGKKGSSDAAPDD